MADLIKFTIVFDKETGALKDVQGDLAGMGQAIEKINDSGQKQKDIFSQVGSSLQRAGLQLILIAALKAALDTTEAFNDLKGAVGDTARVFLDTFKPVLDLISKGLQGTLIILQGFMSASQKLIKGDWSGAMDDMAKAVQDAANRIEGHTKQMTTQLNDALKVQIENRRSHNEAMTALQRQFIEFQMQELFVSEADKRRLIQEEQDLEAQAIRDGSVLKLQEVTNSESAHVITKQVASAQRIKIAQEERDALSAVSLQGTLRIAQLEQEKTKAIVQSLNTITAAGANAAVERRKQTTDTVAIIRAGAAGEVQAIAGEAQKFIQIETAKAAAKALVEIPFPANLAAVAAILAVGTTLAAGVGIGGGQLAGAVAGPGAGAAPSAPGEIGGGAGFGGTAGGFTGAAEVGGAPPTGPVRPNVIINISGADMLDNEKVTRAIAEQIDKMVRS